MKTPSLFIILIAVLTISCAVLQAQTLPPDQHKPPLPPKPWPAQMPDMASWTVTTALAGSMDGATSAYDNQTSQSQDNSTQAHEVDQTIQLKSTIVKTWPVVHEIAIDNTNKKWDKWYNSGVELSVDSTGTLFFVRTSGGGFFFQDYSNSDFGGFDWLSANNYQGVKNYMGHQCYFFQIAMKAAARSESVTALNPAYVISKDNPDTSVFYTRAYLDMKTMFPVMLQKGPYIQTYILGPPPTVSQTVPSVLIQRMQARAKEEKRKAIAPSRPY
jgi:hypothetical protein